MGKAFDTCSIINAKSGNCPEDCKWCAQSAHYSTSAERYSVVSPSACVAQASYNRKQGIGRFSLDGAVADAHHIDLAIGLATPTRHKRAHPELKCCASLGLLTEPQLKKLFDSGVTTYHCNVETSPSYFRELCTTHTQEDKEATLEAARRVGMRICCGGIIGMGETLEQRVELAFYVKRLKSYSIPINILQPITGTPLGNSTPLTEDEVLSAIAVFRMVNPRAFLRFSGGRAQLSPETQYKAIYVGINAAITGDLLTTIGRQAEDDMKMIEACGKVNTPEDWEVHYNY